MTHVLQVSSPRHHSCCPSDSRGFPAAKCCQSLVLVTAWCKVQPEPSFSNSLVLVTAWYKVQPEPSFSDSLV